MKKITLLLVIALTANTLFAQNLTTGVIQLRQDFSVKFDVDTGSSFVTMTLVGPSNVWLAIAPGVASGNSMGNLKDDAVAYSGSGLQDLNMTGGTNKPNVDAIQNWTEVSNTVQGSVRTYEARRAINTGDALDFIFPTTDGATFPILWAMGTSFNFLSHKDRNGVIAKLSSTLSVDSFDESLKSISIYPNPASSKLTIYASSQIVNDLHVEVYNILGEKVFNKTLSKKDAEISVSNWSNGVYVMKITSDKNDKTVVKRFVKI